MFVVSLVCIEHSSSVILCLDCIECCINAHVTMPLAVLCLLHAVPTNRWQRSGASLAVRCCSLCDPSRCYLPAHAERGVFGPAFAGYSCGYTSGYSKNYTSTTALLRSTRRSGRGGGFDFHFVCLSSGCAQFRQKGRGKPPSTPSS
jgi:hypothetical protein